MTVGSCCEAKVRVKVNGIWSRYVPSNVCTVRDSTVQTLIGRELLARLRLNINLYNQSLEVDRSLSTGDFVPQNCGGPTCFEDIKVENANQCEDGTCQGVEGDSVGGIEVVSRNFYIGEDDDDDDDDDDDELNEVQNNSVGGIEVVSRNFYIGEDDDDDELDEVQNNSVGGIEVVSRNFYIGEDDDE
eukprot:TRINITY_DN1735_c0_g1_i1.p1 TRINITY_DN1735_c0_g1~~TRINITY_DN1735_c0_g1_i1.p1  ORF type:complete len:187 (-),score=84.09 TRINITY_DN1735_c0_g1_i1:121-681(-)